MVTAFGKFCRKLRIDHGEVLKDMADKLDVKSSFLSAVELGKKSIPRNWLAQITEKYQLTPSEIEELENAISLSVRTHKFDLTGYKQSDREIVLSFARKFDRMSEDEKQQLKKWFSE